MASIEQEYGGSSVGSTERIQCEMVEEVVGWHRSNRNMGDRQLIPLNGFNVKWLRK